MPQSESAADQQNSGKGEKAKNLVRPKIFSAHGYGGVYPLQLSDETYFLSPDASGPQCNSGWVARTGTARRGDTRLPSSSVFRRGTDRATAHDLSVVEGDVSRRIFIRTAGLHAGRLARRGGSRSGEEHEEQTGWNHESPRPGCSGRSQLGCTGIRDRK